MKYFKCFLPVIYTCLLISCSKVDKAKLDECEHKSNNLAESSLYYQAKLQIQSDINIKLEQRIESEVKFRVRNHEQALQKERESMINETNHARTATRNIVLFALIGILVGFIAINYWCINKFFMRKPKDAE